MTFETEEVSSLAQAGLLVWPLDRTSEKFQDSLFIRANFGAKVAGLYGLPEKWVPHFVALPTSLYSYWREDPITWIERGRENGVDLESIATCLPKNSDLIVRSSAVGESMDDRGKYKSIIVKNNAGYAAFIKAIVSVYEDFDSDPMPFGMAICVQVYRYPEIAGHVSNEVRLSATRNQWRYGVSIPVFAPEKGLNSKFADPPPENAQLSVSKAQDLSKVLRRICHWVNKRIATRAHLEWCVCGGELQIVQLDEEEPTSLGEDPHQMPSIWFNPDDEHATHHSEIFTRYRIQDDPPWRKLQNIRDFWTDADTPKHILYYVTGDKLLPFLNDASGKARIASEIDALTGGRAVLRTDCNDDRIPRFNLPRTNTVDGLAAVDWMVDALRGMVRKSVFASNIAFILHRYIPARAAAWSYYSVGDDLVIVDCLWGLPDGLQFLEHDSYQLDARTGDELAADVPYKRHFLQEQSDGSWSYVKVARQFGRDRVLSREALRYIAAQTVKIAHKIKEQAQVMWFCDIPAEVGLGEHLPWFRSKDFSVHTETKRPPLQEWPVRTADDIKKFKDQAGRRILRVDPAAELVRDDEAFLDQVVGAALERGVPVQLMGSTLGHAYYKLRSSGVLVVSGGPTRRRIRKKKVFRKLVRDAMPANIAAKGEQVSFGRLGKSDAVLALIGKLFEEAMELQSATSVENQVEELADVLEVIRGISSVLEVNWVELNQVAEEKRAARGGFEQQTVLMETGRRFGQNLQEPRIAGERDAQISLRDVGPIRTGDGFALVPFTRLVASERVVFEVPWNGRLADFTLSTGASGLEIQIREKEAPSEDQAFQPDFFDRLD